MKREIITWESRDRDNDEYKPTSEEEINNSKCRGRVFEADPETMHQAREEMRRYAMKTIVPEDNIEKAPESAERRVNAA